MSDSVDELIQCPTCDMFWHVSWFSVGLRSCRMCEDEAKNYIHELAAAVVKAERETAQIPGEMIQLVINEEKPDEITSHQWRLLHLLNAGVDDIGIALGNGVTVDAVEGMKKEALTALYAVVDKRHEDQTEPELVEGNRKERRIKLLRP